MNDKSLQKHRFRVGKLMGKGYIKPSDWNRFSTAKSVFRNSVTNSIFRMLERALGKARFVTEPFQLVSAVSGIFFVGLV